MTRFPPVSLFLVFLCLSCADTAARATPESSAAGAESGEAPARSRLPSSAGETEPQDGTARALFAGGCFWCVEAAFEPLEGVVSVVSGYAGGVRENPTYNDVSGHRTQHLEVVQVSYDPSQVSYESLLSVFWHNIDPSQGDGQFCDRGHQYTSAIFVQNDAERALAEASRDAVAAQLGSTVVTDIRPNARFWPAEDYHQDYYRTNPMRYQLYRRGCGRDARLRELWGEDAGGH